MAIDPVTRKAFRAPMFILGTVMVVGGLVPLIAILISGWNGASNLSMFSVFVPIGAALMALARSKASQEWKRGR